ncbi:MAG: PAS domain S-box protein, partial [Candidatus Aminicenantes bacterium]|nr:PAS domain S-box protein [Candidatus Aminicenantes bacterium]
EDVPEDAELVERELHKEKISFVSYRTDNKQGFLKGLKKFKPDLILSDYALPRFNGLEALELVKEKAPEIPFIMVTGSINEETAVECMKKGSWDYVIKEHLSRLGYAVINALKLKAENDKKKLGEEALQESEEKFRNFVETSADLVFRLTKTGRIDYVSPRVEDLYGYRPDELIGKHLRTTTPVREVSRAIKALNMVLAGKPIRNFEIEQKHKTGRIIPMEINAVPVYRSGKIISFQGIMRDITERKRAEEKIRKLSTAVMQSPSVIAITDLKGNLEYVNPKFTELTGYTSKEAIGQNPRILKSGELPDELYIDLWDTISSGKVWRGEFHNKKKNGESFWEAASISPIFNKQDKIINYIKVAEDITERKQNEEELKQHREHLEDLVKERTSELEAFTYSVSHDLRGPLSSIIGFNEIMNERYGNILKGDAKRFCENISSSALNMSQLIEDLLSYSKLSDKKLEIVNVDLNSIIIRIKMDLGNTIDGIGAEIVVRSDMPDVSGNTTLVSQVFLNLINNSIIYRDKKKPLEIEINWSRVDEFIIVRVIDNGIGIDPEFHKKIFKVFQRLNPESEYSGTGIGLAIVEKSMKIMGGEVRIESESGKGSTFILKFKTV